jgi:hypothetical protein
VVRPVLPIGAPLDLRLLDGYQAGGLATRLTEIVTNLGTHLGSTARVAK